ncbi:MAG: HaeIII family restriction endonuclease [Ruminococcaceae bacterium]|nr:HaeIII family restriction endonuclease [Oscillospiraceae bacterium]
MALSNTEYGKAYEYACLLSLKKRLLGKTNGKLTIVESDAYKTAQNAFCKAKDEGVSENLIRAADAAARVIVRLEPQLEYGNGKLSLAIQTDAQGIAGDVRDVVCIRRENDWEIGISCKHNHHAVKHSRLSATIDFGKEWFDVPCSNVYFNKVVPIFNELRDMRIAATEKNMPFPLWNDIPDKAERFYIPILCAFLEELDFLASKNSDIPRKLIEYMIGRYDFYKVITDDRHRTTRVEAINIAGSLNSPINGHRSMVDVAKLKLPTRFYHMGLVPNSNNKIEIVCDEGWTLTMRIHNASSKVEPSLKFDVQLVSLPSSIHAQVEPW